MPANFDLYSTATMLKAVEQMPPINTFLSDTFCADGEVCDDNRAIYDYRKGAVVGLAPFVVPGTGGTPMNREPSELRFIEFADLAPERIITMEDVSHRQFGEGIMGTMTPEQRSKRLLTRDLVYLRTLIQNTINWMAREVLLTGKLEIRRQTAAGREKEASLKADFKWTNIYEPATKWNQAGANIHYDMEYANDLLAENLADMDVMVMDPAVFHIMMANEKFAKTLDMKNVDMGEIRTRYQGQGVRFRGVNSDGVEFYTLSGKFMNYDRQMENHLPAGTILCGSKTKKPLKVMYGPIAKVTGKEETAKMNFYIKKQVPFRIGGSESDTLGTRLVSRPTIVPENAGGWVRMNVL